MTGRMNERSGLRFGLPSKGRLQAQMAEYLSRRGVELVKSEDDRRYEGELIGVDGVELIFLQAGEMPAKLAAGDIHLGVTGEDLIRERATDWRRRVSLVAPLGFGHADVVVAVPQCWIDVATTDDLDDVAAEFRARHGHPLRVATKYARLTRGFFAERGVANYRLVDSQGATEGLVAAGAAEAIVDITSSGATLKANHLKILEDGLILKSEAHLCASLVADWTDEALAALRAVLDRMGGAPQERSVSVTAKIDPAALARAEPALRRVGAEFRKQPLAGFPGAAELGVDAAKLGMTVDILSAAGATAIETAVETLGDGSGRTLYQKFVERLEQ